MLEKSYGINVYACICTLLEQVNTSLQPASVNQHTCATIDFQVNQQFHSWYVDNGSVNGLLYSSYWIVNYIYFTQTFPLEGSITPLFMILFLFWAMVSTLIQAKATPPWALLIILDSLRLCLLLGCEFAKWITASLYVWTQITSGLFITNVFLNCSISISYMLEVNIISFVSYS